MPKYVIERTIPGAGELSSQDLEGISKKSCDVLQRLGTNIQWLESYVTDDKVYCVYLASSPEIIRKHAREGEFPVDSIAEVHAVISPATAGYPPELK